MAEAQTDWPDGGPAGWIEVDVSNPDAVDAALRETQTSAGSIDIAVNNAGISGPNMTTWDYPVEDWRRVIDIDLTGPYLVCRAVVPLMRDAGYGRIVNIASVAGKEGNPNAPAYSAAKGGLIALTKSLGKELAGSGVLVNCVTPAAVETRIFRSDDPGPHRHDEVENPDGTLRPCPGRSRPWSLGSAPRTARSPPAACSTFPAAAQRTDFAPRTIVRLTGFAGAPTLAAPRSETAPTTRGRP